MRISAAAALLLAAAQAVTPPPCTKFSPNPIPTSQLPAFFPSKPITSLASLSAVEEIRQTLSSYAQSIDGRAFDALADVFTTNATANYSAPVGVLTGVQQIESTLSASLAMFAGTQHLLGSQRIRICDADTAISATYFRAAHFLPSNATFGATALADDSVVLTAYAQYQDAWVRRDEQWRIAYRNVVYMGPLVTDLN